MLNSFFGRKKLLKIVIISLLILFIAIPYALLFNYIPQEIKLIVGQKQNFHYNMPINAQINSEKQGILKVNNNFVKENINISLNQPFTVESDEIGTIDVELKLFGFIPIRSLKVDIIEDICLIPCGRTIGVDIKTNGIMILGTGVVHGVDGNIYEPSKGILQTGDLILQADGETLHNQEQLIDIITALEKQTVLLKIKRNSEIMQVVIKPEKSIEDQKNKIGVYVRDSTQGIGTVTYINQNKMTFGALGHGITDIDTKQLMPIREGNILDAQILSIKKGLKGTPGEIEGTVMHNEESKIGEVLINEHEGIFGRINDIYDLTENIDPIPIALQQEVKAGKAYILSNIEDDKIEKYDVIIHKVSAFNNNMTKGMIIEITDERLISRTNGIIQGMSGSPIIQNDKLIGAVTHVFVQNPAKGYGIFIENMLKKEKKIDKNIN